MVAALIAAAPPLDPSPQLEDLINDTTTAESNHNDPTTETDGDEEDYWEIIDRGARILAALIAASPPLDQSPQAKDLDLITDAATDKINKSKSTTETDGKKEDTFCHR